MPQSDIATGPVTENDSSPVRLLKLATAAQQIAAGGGGGGAPTGPAGGDLSGTYPNPSVTGFTGTLAIAHGGTGQTTAPLALAALNGVSTLGGSTITPTGTTIGLIIQGGSGGATGDVLQVNNGSGPLFTIKADGTAVFGSSAILSSLTGVFLDTDGAVGFLPDGLGGIIFQYASDGSKSFTLVANGNATFPNNVTAASFTGTGTVSADSGWTANADAGTKTASIGTTASIAGMVAALNLVSPGLGTVLAAVAEKCKALETVLVASKIPNA